MSQIDSNLNKFIKTILKTHYKDVLRTDRRTGLKFWDYPAMASVCYTPDRIIHSNGCSQDPRGIHWHRALQVKMRSIGRIGEHTPYCGNILGRCAEQHAANNLGKKKQVRSLEIDRVVFSESVRPRTMEIFPPCENCKAIFPMLR